MSRRRREIDAQVPGREFDKDTGLAIYSEAEWFESVGVDDQLRVLTDHPLTPDPPPSPFSYVPAPTVDELRAAGLPDDATIQANLDRGLIPRANVEKATKWLSPMDVVVSSSDDRPIVTAGAVLIAGICVGLVGLGLFIFGDGSITSLLRVVATVLGGGMVLTGLVAWIDAKTSWVEKSDHCPNPVGRAVRTFAPVGREGGLLTRAADAVMAARSSRAWQTDPAHRTHADLVEHLAVVKSRCRRTIAIREQLEAMPEGVNAAAQVKILDQVLDSTETLVTELEGYADELEKLDEQLELFDAEDRLGDTSDALGDLLAETGADVHQVNQLRHLGADARARAQAIEETRTRLASHVLALDEQVNS